MRLHGPAHRLRHTLLLALAACGAEPEPAPPASTRWPVRVEPRAGGQAAFERVVLVTIDTLRADHLSCYGYPRATTPFLDSLAARGVRFTRALAAVSHTAPSHATLLTGLVPAVHGVLQNGSRLDPQALDLAALFARQGFETAAFLNVGFLRGITASFGHVEVRADKDERVQRGDAVVDAALAWLTGKRAGPRFLLWVHLYDPHRWQEYMLAHEGGDEAIWKGSTPDDFLVRLAESHGLPAPEPGKPYAVPWGGKTVDKTGQYTAEKYVACVDAYDELTRFADRQVERLHAGLEALALPGRTLWVVTSDHGEGLASHGYAGHTGRIYQEQLHVPLIVHASDGSLAPRVVEALVGHVDLLPTLAETLGLALSAPPGASEGRSLWPHLRGEPAAEPARLLFAQRRPPERADDPDPAELYALQNAQHKLIRKVPGGEVLFELARDPRELAELGADHAAAAELGAALEARLEAYRALAPAPASEDVPEEWLQELRDLGYAR